MTTVGYGDFSPQSEVGRVITAVAMCLGLCFTAMPLAIVGNTFSTAWDARALSVIREQVRPTIAPPQPFLSALMPPLSDLALLLLVVYLWYSCTAQDPRTLSMDCVVPCSVSATTHPMPS